MARILVVDDEAPIRHMLNDLLTDTGHEVLESEDGEQAIQILSDNDVDLVITDLVMPKLSGIQLIMSMQDEDSDIPIIAISGGGGITGRFDYLPIAQLIGAERIIRKPFSMQEMSIAVTNAVGHTGQA